VWPQVKCSRCGHNHCLEVEQIKPQHPEAIEAARVIFEKRWANVEEIRETHPEWLEIELTRADRATDALVAATQDYNRWVFPNTVTTSKTAAGYVIHCIDCP